jgi:chemotaxis signal transduction protein
MIVQGTSIERMMAGPRCMAGKMPFYKGDIPVINPLQVLPFPDKETVAEDSNILMIRHNEADYYGFAVDHILGVRPIKKDQFLTEDPPKAFSNYPAMRGQVWLEDRTIHIIDPRQLLSHETIRQCRKALSHSTIG